MLIEFISSFKTTDTENTSVKSKTYKEGNNIKVNVSTMTNTFQNVKNVKYENTDFRRTYVNRSQNEEDVQIMK